MTAAVRVGIGYDSHRFGLPGSVLKLGGVAIPHRRGLAGHSDADVVLHALADALLGAVGAPDLGELFPSSDMRHRMADSRAFIDEACRRVREAGWRPVNVDAVVIADEPRLSAHKPAIRAAIAKLLGVPLSSVSIKGKSCEGFPPGTEGIVAQVVVLVERAAGARPPARRRAGATTTRRRKS